MTISFEREDKELILRYSPEMGTDEIADRLSSGKEVTVLYETPKELNDYGISTPPQSFTYLTDT